MYEEDHNYEECCESYRQASDYYMGENKEQASNQCLLKVADLPPCLPPSPLVLSDLPLPLHPDRSLVTSPSLLPDLLLLTYLLASPPHPSFSSSFSSSSSSNELKVAELSALLERFDYATETFEKVALSARDHNMQLLNVNDYFLRAGLCQLANGGPIRKGLHSHKVLRYYLKKWVSVEYSFVYSR
jgi:hypothetical protein